ncbi:MAG: hypothetical protein IPN20_08190 [Haliscomenobacter sp.]|nr:hypothetical protein [Haliscomenobacter sp.]
MKTLELFEVVQVDANLIKEAIDIQTIHQLSFWDSMILAAAKKRPLPYGIDRGHAAWRQIGWSKTPKSFS